MYGTKMNDKNIKINNWTPYIENLCNLTQWNNKLIYD